MAKAPSPPAQSVTVDMPKEGGRMIVRVSVAGHVTTGSAGKLAAAVAKKVDEIEGRPFGLLFDLRKVTEFDDDAATAMQKIEMDAAAKGLEAVAHLVAQPEIVKQLDAELKKLGAGKLIGNFTDESKARAFASGM